MTERCAEYHDKLPFSSKHIWNVEIHGIPFGPCLNCGELYSDYSERLTKEIQPLVDEWLKKCAQERERQ